MKKLPYGIKFYTNDGHFAFAEYKSDFYEILQLYVQDMAYISNGFKPFSCRPTLWILDENMNYMRVHDFLFTELSPETYAKYKKEHILSTDYLLEKI